MERGRTHRSIFTYLFLTDPRRYGKRYHLVQPFEKLGFFESSKFRSRFIKAMLHTNAFLLKCSNCGAFFDNMLEHKLQECTALANYRQLLRLKLTLYNAPSNCIENLNEFSRLIISSRPIVNAFTHFLDEIDF